MSATLTCTRELAAAISKDALTGLDPAIVFAPIVSQEVWAAGVTY